MDLWIFLKFRPNCSALWNTSIGCLGHLFCLFCKDAHRSDSLCCKGDICTYCLVCGSHAPFCLSAYLPLLLLASLCMTWDVGPESFSTGYRQLQGPARSQCGCWVASCLTERTSLRIHLSFMRKTWPSLHCLSLVNLLGRQERHTQDLVCLVWCLSGICDLRLTATQ